MVDKTIIFVDDGFLAKLSKYFGGGKYLKFDRITLCKNIAKNQNLECEKIFYYTAPPFKSNKPTKDEIERDIKYKRFKEKLLKDDIISVKEGRCQRIDIGNKFIYKQKAVDPLLVLDIMAIPIECPNIKKVILIASDSDFVPVIEKLKKFGIETILYTYFVKKRDTGLSRSNYLMRAVSKYIKFTKEDFDNAPLNKVKESKDNNKT